MKVKDQTSATSNQNHQGGGSTHFCSAPQAMYEHYVATERTAAFPVESASAQAFIPFL